MKVSARQTEAFLREPPQAVSVVLLFGPDEGLVRQRADRLARSRAPARDDPFALTVLTPPDLQGRAGRLAEELATTALFASGRAIWLRPGRGPVADAVLAALAVEAGGNLLIVEAGELRPGDRLRKAVEAAANGAAIPCYRAEGSALSAQIRQHLDGFGLRADPEATAFLAENLGADAELTARELEKLAVYAGPGANWISLADVQAVVGDGSAFALDDLVIAAGDRDAAAVDRGLTRCFESAIGAHAILRAMLRHFQMLHAVAARLAEGEDMESARRAGRVPPVPKYRGLIERQCRHWTKARLEPVLNRLLVAEEQAKSGGQPDDLLTARTVLAIAGSGRRAS